MSRPGLSMWGKEGEPMTPQERAAAIAEQIVKALDVHPSPINIDAVLPWVQQTRRAALLEAMEKVKDRALLWRSHGGAKIAFPYDHLTVEGECDVIAAALDRLAQEG